MKKLLTVLLSFMLAVSLVPAPALAEAMEELEMVTQGGGTPAQATQPAPTQGQGQPAEQTQPQSQGEGAMGEDAQSGEGQPGQQPAAPAEQQPSDPVLTVQEDTGPKTIWLEQYEKLDNEDGHWQDNRSINPMKQYRIRASNKASTSSYDPDANPYEWANATDTITFVSTTDTSKRYQVILKSDRIHIDGLFYQSDGMALPLPAGSYTITFMTDAMTGHSTSTYSNGAYTVDEGDGHVFKGYYETDANGAFTRNSLSVKAAGTTQELGLVDLNASVDLRLSVNTATTLTETPTIGTLNKANPQLSMFKAKDANGALTLAQLQTLQAAGTMDAWPTAFSWSGGAVEDKPVWSRADTMANATSGTGNNGTTWSFTPTVGEKAGVFAINNLKFGEKYGTEPTPLQPGVYFPVLRLSIDGLLYYYAYNPIEVGTVGLQAPTITTATLPDGMKGTLYTSTLAKRSGVPTGSTEGTFSWAVTSGTLPQGLSLDAQTGVISGTLANDATAQTFTVTLTETVDGTARTASKQYTINVRDAVTLGAITYTPTGTIYIEDQNGETMHLSVPISADLTNGSLNLKMSEVAYSVYQTARNSTSSLPTGGVKPVSEVYNATSHTLEIDAPIDYTTSTVDRIEVNLRLKDNAGNQVQVPKAGTDEGEWAIVTAAVANPSIVLGSYLKFPALSFENTGSSDLPKSVRVRLWPYVEGSTAIPATAQEQELTSVDLTGWAQFQLEPGDYVFAIDGEVPIYDMSGQATENTRRVDVVGSVTDATPIDGTNPKQYKITVGPNDGTQNIPRTVGVTYTTKNAAPLNDHYLNVLFQDQTNNYVENDQVYYEVNWYRRKGDSEVNDVLVATGPAVRFGPSPYDLYVEVIPSGRNASFWLKSPRIKVENNDVTPTVLVPRRGLFTGTFTLSCESGKQPAEGGSWGIIEVQTPIASGGYSSYNMWPTRNAGNTVEIPGLTSGSIVTLTPRIELQAGPVSYTVPNDVSANFTASLTAPQPHSLISFEGLNLQDVNGKTGAFDLNDGLTGVAVTRVSGDGSPCSIPYYVADGTHIVLQPEMSYNRDYYLENTTPTPYDITITRRDGNAPERMGTTCPDVVMSETRRVTLSQNQTSATFAMGETVVSRGYVNVPFSNPAKKRCTLLLYDSSGKLVESGPAGASEQLRTPYLPAGQYDLYAIDTNYLPKNASDYQEKADLHRTTLAGGNASRATSTKLTIEQGKATTASTFTFPTNTSGAIIDQEKSSVKVETAYTDKLAINMHAVLAEGATLGTGAHLEISTNQPTDKAGVYMNPRALNINDKPVSLSQWREHEGPVFGTSSNMRYGSLDINLDELAKINQAYVEFPMDMTLVIPQTVFGYTEASVWLVAGDGTRSLVGSYQSDTAEVTVEAPQVIAWRTFTVNGEARPNALVTVYLEGMRAATARADAYGYYEAEITLPANARDYSEYSITASAQWTRGEAAYAAVSDMTTTMYSTTFPAVESIVMCYQPKADASYTAARLYYRGSQPSRYLTIQRDGHVQDLVQDEKDSKYFYVVTFANSAELKSATLDIPAPDGNVTPSVTDALSVAESWIEGLHDAGVEQDEYYELFVRHGWPLSNGAQVTKTALTLNGEEGTNTRSFVSKPLSMVSYSDEVHISYELTEVDEDAVLVNILPASDLGSYNGWASEKVGDNAINQAQLKTLLGSTATYREDWGRLITLTSDDYSNRADAKLGSLVSDEKIGGRATTLMGEGGNIDEWLLVGGASESGEDLVESFLPLHHTVTTEPMNGTTLRDEVNTALADAKKVTDAFEKWEKDGTAPTDESVGTYKGDKVLCAGGVASTGERGRPYFIETYDAGGNAQVESMETYVIENSDNLYVHCQTFMSKGKLVYTWWNERYNQKVTITYELPANAQANRVLRFADVLEQWTYIQMAIDGGLLQGNKAAASGGISGQSLGTQSEEPTGLASPLLQVQGSGDKGSPKKPQQQQNTSTIEQVLTEIGNWKLWLDGKDKPNEKITGAIEKGRKTDVTNIPNSNSNWWDSPAAQGSTVGDAYGKKEKVEAVVEASTEGGKEVLKDEAGHFIPGAGKVFKLADHWDWIKKQARKITGREEWAYGEWNRYLDNYGDPRSNKIARKGYLELIAPYDRETLDRWTYRRKAELKAKAKQKENNPPKKSDPSGVVYEAVLSNPVEGATVTLYTYNSVAAQAELDPAQFVDSMLFGLEDNPQVTGADGRYQWFVPEGYWQIRVTKGGYESVSTGDSADYGLDATKSLTVAGADGKPTTVQADQYWMPVLPIQLDVNIPLVSKEPPKIESFVTDETGATVTFNKYVQLDTVSASMFTLDGKAPASFEAVDAEVAGDGSGKTLARTFRLAYADGPVAPGTQVAAAFADSNGGVTSYAGVKAKVEDRTYSATPQVVESRVSIVGAEVAVDTSGRTYNGTAFRPVVTSVKVGDKTLVAGTDYAVAYGANTAVGTGKVTITGKGGYKGSVSKTFVIAAANIALAGVSAVADQTYTSKAFTPKPAVKFDGATLREGTDYALAWRNNVNAGTATVTVTGKGNFTGTKSATFKINPATISSVSVSTASFTYDGTAKTPGVTVKAGSLAVPASDYTVTYANNVNAGTATVTVKGKGNFTGTKTASFTIKAAKTFPDVPANAWYAGVVSRAVSLGLMSGYKDGRFGPTDKVTRGQVAVILWNMAGNPAAGPGARTFPDVASNQYFYNAVRWASSKGVVSGYGNGRFGPNDDVTREQFAVMLANYARSVAGRQVTGSAADYAKMRDGAKVSSWAQASVGWCFRNQIISGTKDGNVNPKGNATRAEAAKMVVFLHDLLK